MGSTHVKVRTSTIRNMDRGAEKSVFDDPWVGPGQEVLRQVSEKWVSLVICALRDGPRRFGELQRSLDGVSQKMLTQTLRRMERAELVSRHVIKAKPPKVVEYALTPRASTLVEPLERVLRWADTEDGDAPAPFTP
jgi:DNA-binding HxlR family transcriptional regulator